MRADVCPLKHMQDERAETRIYNDVRSSIELEAAVLIGRPVGYQMMADSRTSRHIGGLVGPDEVEVERDVVCSGVVVDESQCAVQPYRARGVVPLDPVRPPFLVEHLYRSHLGTGFERNPSHVQSALVRIGLKVDLDPSGEVLAVDLEGVPGPGPAGEPGDFPSGQPG